MTNNLKKKLRSNKGFTLVEMVIVLAIIGVIAALAIPVYGNIMEKANQTADEANAKTVETAVAVYQAEEGALPSVGDETDAKAAFNAVVTELHRVGYLKDEALEAKSEGHSFTYDKSNGTVSITPAFE